MKGIAIFAALGIGILVVTAEASLVAYFSFDNGADPFADTSGSGNNIAGATGIFPTWGATSGFDGTGAYDYAGGQLIVPVDVNPGAMPQMTWGAWVRTDDVTNTFHKVMGHDNGGWDRAIGLDNRDGGYRYTAFAGTSSPQVVGPSPGPTSTTDWAFLAAVYDNSLGTVTMYVDLDASTNADPLLSASSSTNFDAGGAVSFAIGGIRPDLVSEAWDGAIDQVFLFDEALDLSAVTALRDAGRIPEPSGLLLSLAGLVLLSRRRRRSC